MPVNADKPHRWKADVAQSVDFYNAWFIRFAPEAYREQREQQTKVVEESLERTDHLRNIAPDLLRTHPSVLPMLRMATAPPLARDRLIGLAYVTPNLVKSMEGTKKRSPRIPPRMSEAQLDEELRRIARVVYELADRDLFTWLDGDDAPAEAEVHRAATVLADRLCGAAADPIIRNAQERRQLAALRDWLEARGYRHVTSASVPTIRAMEEGTFTFFYNVPVKAGKEQVNIPIDCAVQPMKAGPGSLPLLIEAKSAGDFANTNKRRKEEAQKANQLRATHGEDVRFNLFLCGYFDTPYLGYEAAEGIDWVWEHRIDDLALLLGGGPSGEGGTAPDEPRPVVGEARVNYDSEDERRRLAFQQMLDGAKSQEERNRLGQFATPPGLAADILRYACSFFDATERIDFLDPAFGTGAFFSALLDTFAAHQIGRCRGFEIDPHYGRPAQQLWEETPLDLTLADFTVQQPPTESRERFNLLIANPPYVRHHHVEAEEKKRLGARAEAVAGVRPSGLSGLYAYFLYLAHAWMREGGVAGWLIPSEFMVVNYGQQVRQYLLDRVALLHIHQFDPKDGQFEDAIVSSAVVWFRKQKPQSDHEVRFTYGGSLLQPARTAHLPIESLRARRKWNGFHDESPPAIAPSTPRVSDLFTIRRGIATGANKFFILPLDEARARSLPTAFLRPVLPSPRYLHRQVIDTDASGLPLLDDPLVLLACGLPECEVEARYPALWSYLQEGIEQGIHKRYLCRNRTPWYVQEERDPAPFLCSYMGRGSKDAEPFRFVRNRSDAVATNVYLNLYPKPFLQRALAETPDLADTLWEALNNIRTDTLISNGRTYGGGLHKLEPKELAHAPLVELASDVVLKRGREPELFEA